MVSAQVSAWDRLFPTEPDSAARRCMVSSAVWLAVGTLAGLTTAIEFFAPDVVKGVPWLEFGRIRPLHVNMMAFGFLSMGHLAAMFYIVPRLTRVRLYSERLAHLDMWLWNLGMLGAFFALPLGITEGREYAELPAWLDWPVLALILLTGYIVFRTVAARKERQLYVSLWYFMGTLMWMPVIYFIGNRTFGIRMPGLNDALINWFYGHNILGLWFTTTGVGIAYYLLPRLTQNALYSHSLSLLGFWTIAIFYAPVGTHHLLQAPVPEWLKAIAVTSSVMLLVPVLTVLVNFFMTMQGKWNRAADSLPLRFLVFGMMCYLGTCFQGPLQATRSINWYVHFTNWVVAHAHLALLGTFSFFMWAFVYYALPRIVQRPMYSQKLVSMHFWLASLGFTLFFSVLMVIGLIQATAWDMGVPIGKTVVYLQPYWITRGISAFVMTTGFLMFSYNVLKTVTVREPAVARELAPVPTPGS